MCVSSRRWTAPSRTAPSAALVRDLTFLRYPASDMYDLRVQIVVSRTPCRCGSERARHGRMAGTRANARWLPGCKPERGVTAPPIVGSAGTGSVSKTACQKCVMSPRTSLISNSISDQPNVPLYSLNYSGYVVDLWCMCTIVVRWDVRAVYVPWMHVCVGWLLVLLASGTCCVRSA